MRIEGLLLALVPWDREFYKLLLGWMNGPMGEWWGMDYLRSQAERLGLREKVRVRGLLAE